MSDGPQGPGWWQATDGRGYPPAQFTGPPELRHTVGQPDPGSTDVAAGHDPEPSARRPGRLIVLLDGGVSVPTIRLTYDCDTAGVCSLRRAG